MNKKPFLEILSYSAGRQSKWALEKILRGEWKKPKRFAVINANPGMEKQETRRILQEDAARCEKAGIPFIFAPGPDLYEDGLRVHELKRWDNPPLFTSNSDGSVGNLAHACTREYKIRPIRRAAVRLLESTRFWGSIQQKPAVAFWICFAAEEEHRIKPGDHPAWATARHPMIDAGVTMQDVAADYDRWGIPVPPMSLCNGCPWHGTESRQQQADQDWDEAVNFCEAIRDLRHLKVKSECYISSTCLPLVELDAQGYPPDGKVNGTCNTGMCFT